LDSNFKLHSSYFLFSVDKIIFQHCTALYSKVKTNQQYLSWFTILEKIFSKYLLFKHKNFFGPLEAKSWVVTLKNPLTLNCFLPINKNEVI